MSDIATAGSWGVLGGTFDPVHDAHLAIAEQTRETLALAGVLFVPSGVPVHKPDRQITPVAHRVAMLELALVGNPWFHLERIEVERPGRSYTVDTLRALCDAVRDGRPPFAQEGRGGDDINPAAARDPCVFILSSEALAGFPTWREPDRILELSRLAVVPRHGHRRLGTPFVGEHFPDRTDRFLFLDGPDLGHSASEIRRLAARERSVRYLVPDPVAAYIAQHRLYRSDLWAKN